MTNTKIHSIGRTLLSGSVLRLCNLIGAAASSFFLMPLIVHHLGDRIYGFWSLAASFIGYYNLLDLGLSFAISQYMCVAIGQKDIPECRVVFNTALRLQIMIGCAALLVTATLALATPWMTHNVADIPVFRAVVILLGIEAAIRFPARVYWAVLDAQLRFDVQSWLALIALVLRTGMLTWAVLAGGGLQLMAWMALISSLVATAIQLWMARREALWARVDSKLIDAKRIRNFFAYSLYGFMSYIADVVRFQLDPLVISLMIGLAAVTHYKIAGILTQYYQQIMVATVGMLFPVLSRLHGAGDKRRIEDVFFFGTKLSCSISVFICACIVGWGRPLIARWMGVSYEDGYAPLVVLSFAVLIDVCQRTSSSLFFATFKHRFYAWINCADALINLAFSLALARPFGILGVAAGTFIGSYAIRLIIQPWWVCKTAGFSYLRYIRFLFVNLLRSGCVAASAVWLTTWGRKPEYGLLALSLTCASLIYLAGSWIGVLNHRERQLFISMLRKQKVSEAGELAVASH